MRMYTNTVEKCLVPSDSLIPQSQCIMFAFGIWRRQYTVALPCWSIAWSLDVCALLVNSYGISITGRCASIRQDIHNAHTHIHTHKYFSYSSPFLRIICARERRQTYKCESLCPYASQQFTIADYVLAGKLSLDEHPQPFQKSLCHINSQTK